MTSTTENHQVRDVSKLYARLTTYIIWKSRINAIRARCGDNFIVWDLKNERGRDVSNGMYILRVMAEEKVITKKIAVVR